MRLYRTLKIIFACILLCYALPKNIVYGQEQGYHWGKWSAGQRENGSLMDKVLDSYIDSMGNTYIFGKFGMDARLGENGPQICPMDSCAVEMGYLIGNSQGVFLAKIDSLGNILWCKSARDGSQNSGCEPWNNMVVKDNIITIAFDNHYGSEWWNWFYFFDTMLTESSYPYGQYDNRTYFVSFDLDGNLVDFHNIQLFALSGPSSQGLSMCHLKSVFGSCFTIDEENNTHIFSSGEFTFKDSTNTPYIIVDDDTNRIYTLPLKTMNGEAYTTAAYYKMDSSWGLVGFRYLIDSITGWDPIEGSKANLAMYRSIVVGDEIYVNCYYRCDDYSFIPDTLPVKVFLDSVHYLRIDNTGDWRIMPCLLKLNSNGEIVWTQQLYVESSQVINYIEAGDVATDEEKVYAFYWPGWGNYSRFYVDSAHNTRIPRCPNNSCLIVSYNRITGSAVDYYLVDTINDNMSHNSLDILGDELVLNVAFERLNHTVKETELCRINKYTKEVTRSSPIRYNSGATCNSMSVNDHGWVFRGETGDRARVYDSIFLGNYQEASVMTFFYDSTLDMRRPRPCYAVDSLWSDGTTGQTVTLSWRSQFPHPSYELAYIPEDGSWDDATLMQISDTTATVTLTDNGCHLFRVRGLCEGNRETHGPWSSSVTVCPQVGISSHSTHRSPLNLYPNPTDGTVQILGLPDERVTVEVMDMKGRWVKTIENTSSFNVSDFPSGVYIVHVKTKPDSSVPGKKIYLELVKQ